MPDERPPELSLRFATITETPEGVWRVTQPLRGPEDFESAHAARMKLADRDQGVLLDTGRLRVTKVKWDTCTAEGRAAALIFEKGW